VKPLRLKRIEPTKPSGIQPVAFASAHLQAPNGDAKACVRVGGRCICSWYAPRASLSHVEPSLEGRACGILAAGRRVDGGVPASDRLGFGACRALRCRCCGRSLATCSLCWPRACGLPWGDFSVSKSATYPTRLETRTKESSICASHWAVNPKAQ
jgi:hypothetical protein